MKCQNLKFGLFKYASFFFFFFAEEILNMEFLKKSENNGLDNHLREVMIKVHEHLMKFHFVHKLFCL